MTKEEFNEKWRNIVIQVDGPIDISIVEAINWITRAKVFYDSKKCRRPKPIEIAKDFLSIEDTEIITKESWMNKYYSVVGESFRCTDLSQKYKQIVRKQVFNYKGMLYIQLIDNLYIAKDKSEIIELNTVDTILNIYNSIEKRTENNDSVVEEITK